ncbi:DUF3187 family protein [Vibrio sp. SM6]|uniref:DUF3187 family protein n=1 Tax=Vibrio agarilyticus TaxID=2726741 RepID=A0A7X8TM85_9VIBR|nr:DUF3187 family protein [Vibrio agarilyticus]NLS11346.1 DUF3187 family protein [Vibrio agarilyticus]
MVTLASSLHNLWYAKTGVATLQRTVRFSLFAMTLFASALPPTQAQSQILEPHAVQEYGPLRTYAQSPIQANSLTPQLRDARGFNVGEMELFGSATIASVWAHTDHYTLDYYQNSLSLGWAWQASPQWQWELSYRWVFSADNHIDGVSLAFHQWAGIEQNGRDEVARHRSVFALSRDGFDHQNIEGRTLSSAFSLYGQWQLFQTKEHAISLGGTLYYNNVTNGPFQGHDFEQALQLNYAWHQGSHHIYSSIGATHHGNKGWRNANIAKREFTWSGAVGYQYQSSAHHNWIIEYHAYQGELDNDTDLSKTSQEVVAGYRYVMSQSAIELVIIENVFNMDNSTDVAFLLNYRYRFH